MSINPMFRLELFPPKASDVDANTLKFLSLHPTIKMVNIPHKVNSTSPPQDIQRSHRTYPAHPKAFLDPSPSNHKITEQRSKPSLHSQAASNSPTFPRHLPPLLNQVCIRWIH